MTAASAPTKPAKRRYPPKCYADPQLPLVRHAISLLLAIQLRDPAAARTEADRLAAALAAAETAMAALPPREPT